MEELKAKLEYMDPQEKAMIESLLDIAYECGYDDGKEDAEYMIAQIQSLAFSRVGGTA